LTLKANHGHWNDAVRCHFILMPGLISGVGTFRKTTDQEGIES